jgi:predicted ATPase
MGKTAVALGVGHIALDDFSGAVFFLDLSVLGSKDQVAAAMASAIGYVAPPDGRVGSLLELLRSRRALLILDNCEHLIEQVAEIADRIFQCAPDVCVLATSRETLQTAGENVFRLPPLGCPPERCGQTMDEILSYPATRLFMERVSAQGVELTPRANDFVLVAEICRRLDGIPLAIELAARAAAVFGVRETARRLASRLDLLKLGRRTASPRHQTLRATLDWSYALLSEAEGEVLRRLAIFIGSFTLEAALAVAANEDAGQCDIVDAIGGLVEKSLIVSCIDAHEATYRLLDTTRSYALEKLIASGEHDAIATRHAVYAVQLPQANSIEFFDMGIFKDTRLMKICLGNTHAAVDWRFGPGGSNALAIKLTADVSSFQAKSLVSSCRNCMVPAIEKLSSDCDDRRTGTNRKVIASPAMSRTRCSSDRARAHD